jgi:colicin import membrane protein
MAEAPKAAAGAAATAETTKKPRAKSLWPTNCAQSNKRIRRKDWYFRDGKFFANKQCYKLFVQQEAEKKSKAEAEAKEKAAKAQAEAKAASAAAEAPSGGDAPNAG